MNITNFGVLGYVLIQTVRLTGMHGTEEQIDTFMHIGAPMGWFPSGVDALRCEMHYH